MQVCSICLFTRSDGMGIMPSDKEMNDLQSVYPDMRIWGVDSHGSHQPSRLGDIPVVPFYDVVDALRACEQRVREDGLYVSGVNVGYASGLDAAREAVTALPCMTGKGVYYRDEVLVAIAALRERAK